MASRGLAAAWIFPLSLLDSLRPIRFRPTNWTCACHWQAGPWGTCSKHGIEAAWGRAAKKIERRSIGNHACVTRLRQPIDEAIDFLGRGGPC